MKKEKIDNSLIITLEPRIDINNSDLVEKEIVREWHKSLCKKLILDASELEYISSVGLRILINLNKNIRQGFEIINAQNNVYNIFETTGINQIIPVKKARKQINTDNLEVIGSGSTGVTYKLDDDKAVKVLLNIFQKII